MPTCHTTRLWLMCSALLLVVSSASSSIGSAAASAQGQGAGDSQLKADIQRSFKGLDLGSSRLTVEVKDGVVTLSGGVPSLWTKEEAIRRALKAGHVQSIVADLTIAKAESDEALAREVGKRVRQYDLYTVYDTIDGRVRNGSVTLMGAVTMENKASDIVERVAKVHGVQAIVNKIDVLPANQSDDRLRVAIATAIYRDPAFENYSMADPPIHVIVNNGHVTLIGAVRWDAERIKAESNARSIFGVLALEDKVQVASRTQR